MKIIEQLKKAMNWEELDEATANEIIKDLEDGIESLKEKQDLEENKRKADEGKAWSDRVAIARSKGQKNIARKIKINYLF